MPARELALARGRVHRRLEAPVERPAFGERLFLRPYARAGPGKPCRPQRRSFEDLRPVDRRIENVGNALYEEVYNYSTTARAFYGGVKYAW